MFVGNFDNDVIKDLSQRYLGNLPTIDREETWEDIGIRPKSGVHTDRFNNGEAPKTNVQMFFHGPFEYTDANNYHLSSAIAYLRIKLREKLREELGGVYGVGIYGGGSKKPYPNYGITISFNSDPDKTDVLVDATKEVLKKAMAEGPNAEDMTKVKETQRQTRIKNLKENRFWLRQLQSEHDSERDFDDIELKDYNDWVDGLTAADIQSAIEKYFDFEEYMEFIMEPDAAPTE